MRSYLAMDWSKMPRNCLRAVWYMMFTIDISTMRKYSTEPRVATAHTIDQLSTQYAFH
jgi:hypothetical protein